jgi:hypothetical protein
MTPSCTVIGH